MPRSLALTVAALVLAASLALPARAEDPLVVDAGDSRVAYNGEPLTLSALTLGGIPPYAYAWSWDGDASRIANATARNATFSTAGLSAQDVVVTLTVTDSLGAVASDTVRHRVDARFFLTRTVPITFGVPDETLGAGDVDQRYLNFDLPAGVSRIVASLRWTEPVAGAYDIDFRLLENGVIDRTGGQGATSAHPEVAAVDAPAAGFWRARVEPFASGQSTVRLDIVGDLAAVLPSVAAGGPYVFGSSDAQTLTASANGGVAPLAFAWDLDGDGLYETAGQSVTTSLPVGAHTVRVRATDAAGFEVSAPALVDVRAAETVVRLRCGNDATTPFWAMEFASSKGSCWIHGGHHTYFMGNLVYAVHRVTGRAFAVEQQLSPPTEFATPEQSPMHLQVSMDGQTWTELPPGLYQFLPNADEGSLALPERQDIYFASVANGEQFRFLRVHSPPSASQGLSGYLDWTELDVEVDVIGPLPPPPPAAGTRTYDCAVGDIMEDFFATHPCWFGGVERWDAPSFWHTYYVGDIAHLDRLSGEFTLGPWRADDWSDGGELASQTISGYVQTSIDGVEWTDVAMITTQFGVSTPFDVDVDGAARFVRFFPEYHARFDDMANFAPNHHPKGFFLDSRVTVEGLLPPG